MGLLETVRLGVELANKITKPLQAQVSYERYTSDASGFGSGTYSAPVLLDAIVDFARKQVRTQEGVLSVTRATIDLLDIKQLVAATNGEGVDSNDKFTLPDGYSGPILDISGFSDRGTGNPIATTVMLG